MMVPVVFINCSKDPFIDYIMLLRKLYETRTRNMLKSLVGQRVYLAQTGKGKPVIMASVVISSVLVVETPDAWETVRGACCIEAGSTYDWKPETRKKYLYELTDVKRVKPFTPPEGVRHGRVWMEYEERLVG